MLFVMRYIPQKGVIWQSDVHHMCDIAPLLYTTKGWDMATRKRSMLKQPVRSSISLNRVIENSKDHLYRENSVMPSESLRPELLSRVTKCTPK